MSRRELAKATGINNNTLQSLWRKPVKYHPRADVVYKIADALRTDVDYLMTGQINRRPEEIKDPAKKELIEYIKNADHDEVIEIKTMIKTMRLMDLSRERDRDRKQA